MVLVSKLLVVVALVGVIAGCGGRASEDSVRDVAAAFKVPIGWQESGRHFEPARSLCLGDARCPSLRITWRTSGVLGVSAMREVLDAAGWNLRIEGDCIAKTNVIGQVPVCSATGVVDDLDVTFTQLADAANPAAAAASLLVSSRD